MNQYRFNTRDGEDARHTKCLADDIDKIWPSSAKFICGICKEEVFLLRMNDHYLFEHPQQMFDVGLVQPTALIDRISRENEENPYTLSFPDEARREELLREDQ